MADNNTLQEVDNYVKHLLRFNRQIWGIDVDFNNPTREQRINVALAMQFDSCGKYSLEIMAGRHIDSDEYLATSLMHNLEEAKKKRDFNARAFYETIPHCYQSPPVERMMTWQEINGQ